MLLTPNSFAIWKGFFCVPLGEHASCVLCVRHAGDTGSVRSQGRNLSVSAVRFGVQALACYGPEAQRLAVIVLVKFVEFVANKTATNSTN